MSYLIRTYQPGDEFGLSELIRTTLLQSNGKDYPLSILQPLIDYFSPEKVKILAGERYCLVALAAGRIVGTGALEDQELKTIFVLPEFQGKGIGKAIVQQLEAYARTKDIAFIHLPASITGKAFYLSLGYEEGETFMSEHAGQQTWMKKYLSPSETGED
ncbi:MAG: GNAT family N-acetyltransferase [Bacteroidota bacterium]